MKKSFIYSIMVLAVAAVSCSKSGIAPLSQGENAVFPPAEELVLTKLESNTTAKTETTREFIFKFTGENGASLDAVLVMGRANYALKAGSYIAGETAGSFLPARTKVNGKSVTDKQGVIVVRNQEGSSKYIFEFTLFDTDANPYRAKWTGEIVYLPDPEPIILSQVFTAQSNVASGTNSVTLSLGTSGISSYMDPTTYETIWSGTGNYLALDLYSDDGYLHEGTYKASAAGGVINPGEFGIGWDPGDIWGIGIVFENWGSCWWTVTDGVVSAEKITSGEILVEKKSGKWVITWGSESTYPKWAQFTGEIEALTPKGGDITVDYTITQTLEGAVDNTFTPVEGVTTHKLVFTDKDGVEVAYFDLVLTEGVTDLSGDYTCTEYAHEDHTFGNGYDLSMFGMGMGGSRYADGENFVLVNPGETLNVTSLGDGVYKFSGSTGYEFVGKLSE